MKKKGEKLRKTAIDRNVRKERWWAGLKIGRKLKGGDENAWDKTFAIHLRLMDRNSGRKGGGW